MQEMDPTYEYGEAVDADSPPSLSTRTLRRLLYLAFAALAILLLVLLPPLISVNRYQKRIANSISDSLGRPDPDLGVPRSVRIATPEFDAVDC